MTCTVTLTQITTTGEEVGYVASDIRATDSHGRPRRVSIRPTKRLAAGQRAWAVQCLYNGNPSIAPVVFRHRDHATRWYEQLRATN